MKKLWIVVLAALCSLLTLQNGSAASMFERIHILDMVIGSKSPTTQTHVSVLAHDHAFLSGLDSSALKVFGDNAKMDIHVEDGQVGMAAMILADLCGSMKDAGVVEGQTRVDSLKVAVFQFIDQHLSLDDWGNVIGFHIETIVYQELHRDHALAPNMIYRTSFDLDENTFLLSAASQVLDILHESPWYVDESLGPMRKVLFLFSDGKDYLEKEALLCYREFRAVAHDGRDCGIPIFVVGVGSHCGNNRKCVHNFPENEYSFEDVDWLADQIDGKSYYITSGGCHSITTDEQGDLSGFFNRLASQSWRCCLRYNTCIPKDNHHLKARVNAGRAEGERVFPAHFESSSLELQGAAGSHYTHRRRAINLVLIRQFSQGLSNWVVIDIRLSDNGNNNTQGMQLLDIPVAGFGADGIWLNGRPNWNDVGQGLGSSENTKVLWGDVSGGLDVRVADDSNFGKTATIWLNDRMDTFAQVQRLDCDRVKRANLKAAVVTADGRPYLLATFGNGDISKTSLTDAAIQELAHSLALVNIICVDACLAFPQTEQEIDTGSLSRAGRLPKLARRGGEDDQVKTRDLLRHSRANSKGFTMSVSWHRSTTDQSSNSCWGRSFWILDGWFLSNAHKICLSRIRPGSTSQPQDCFAMDGSVFLDHCFFEYTMLDIIFFVDQSGSMYELISGNDRRAERMIYTDCTSMASSTQYRS